MYNEKMMSLIKERHALDATLGEQVYALALVLIGSLDGKGYTLRREVIDREVDVLHRIAVEVTKVTDLSLSRAEFMYALQMLRDKYREMTLPKEDS